ELVDGAEVTAADRQVSVFDGEGQTVVPADQDLARGPEVDHGTQPEPVEPLHVRAGQLAERVATVQPAADHFRPAHDSVAADVPHVHRAVEDDMTRRGPFSGHRTRLIAHRLTPPKTTLRVTLGRHFTSVNAGYSGSFPAPRPARHPGRD